MTDTNAAIGPLAAADPSSWLAVHLEARYREQNDDHLGTAEPVVVSLADLLADDAARLVAARDRIAADGTPVATVATFLAGWFAGAVAEVVGFALVGGGFGLLTDPAEVRWHLHPDGWPERVEVAPRALVTSEHPWVALDAVEVADHRGQLIERAVAALVTTSSPVIDACHGLAKVGRAGLWNEVGDALGGVLAFQFLVAPTPDRVALLDAAVTATGAPWRARPRLGYATSARLGRVHVIQKGGCCLAYTCPPVGGDDEGEPDEQHRAYLERFPERPGEPRYCSTCSLRSPGDSDDRQVFWWERAHARRAAAGS